MKQFFVMIIGLFSLCQLSAQELNARVQVNAPQVQNLNNRVVELLQKVIQDYLSNQAWTNTTVRPEERIDCGIVINIMEFDGIREFKAEAQVLSSRPVFGTNYSTPILSFRDRNFNFSYEEGEQMDFSENQNLSSLASLIGYYAHIIIGMDMDTFRRNGGTSSFNTARSIMQYSQNSNKEGWRPTESLDNRYWLVNNLTDRRYAPYREFSYLYHREGLDRMSENENEARTLMAGYMDKLKEVDRFNTGNIWSQILFTAKATEFVGLFSRLPGNENVKIYNLLAELDPSNLSRYEGLKR